MSSLSVMEDQPLEPGLDGRTPERLHDLDALRGFAMLLGIGLHAALSFIPLWWPVRDRTASLDGPFDEFVAAVHGFRMPLFFLLSGFFTAMLWQRRGLPALLWHRFRRILLPLAIGVVTIIPLQEHVIRWATASGEGAYRASEARIALETNDLWKAAAAGSNDAVAELLDRGVDVNAVVIGFEAFERWTPLHFAAFYDRPETAALLLGEGANPNAEARKDAATPLGLAIWHANAQVADVLVRGGATDYRRPGQAWEDVAWWGQGAEEKEGAETLGLESWIGNFHHLWFLWFLCWLVVAFGLVVLVGGGIRRVLHRSVVRHGASPWPGRLMWLLVPLTLLPQLAMGGGGRVPTFGPDTSTGLLPMPHVLAYYAVFFAFGALAWMDHTTGGAPSLDRVTRRWWLVLPLGLVVGVLALGATFAPEGRSWLVASGLQVGYTWGLSFGLIGLFRAALSRKSRAVRYLSDASYWMYLVHLPLVVVLQAWMRDGEAGAIKKFVLINVLATIVLLLTYALFVRYTPIGWLLNGRRGRMRRGASR